MKLRTLIRILEAAELRYLEEHSREPEVVEIKTFDDLRGECLVQLREGVKARSGKDESIEEVFGPERNLMIRL